MNLGYVFAHGDGVLVSVFMLLIGMSLLSWYLIFWKAWKLNYQQKLLQRFNKAHAKRHDWPLYLTQETNDDNALQKCRHLKVLEPKLKRASCPASCLRLASEHLLDT